MLRVGRSQCITVLPCQPVDFNQITNITKASTKMPSQLWEGTKLGGFMLELNAK